MSVKKLSFYIDTAKVTVRSDHLPLKKFLEKKHNELQSEQLGSGTRVTEHQFSTYSR